VKIPESNAVKARMLPYVFVGDEVFTLTEDFMNPYNVQKLTKERRIFNYRLSHAQRITENVFIISETKLGIFKTHIKIQLGHIKDTVMAS
jgi:hypothetical protein